MAHPSALAATFIENWPKELRALSIPTRSIPIVGDDLVALGGCSATFRDAFVEFERRNFTDVFLCQIKDALDEFPDGVMPRIGYCSWKASTILHKPLLRVSDVMGTITRDDNRIARGLLPHAMGGAPAMLHLREWQDIPPAEEFRLFILGHSRIGMSQYHRTVPRSASMYDVEVRASLLSEFARRMRHAFSFEDVVIDIYINRAVEPLSVVIIEMNPLDARTDLCLLTSPAEIDGTLRMSGGVVQPL